MGESSCLNSKKAVAFVRLGRYRMQRGQGRKSRTRIKLIALRNTFTAPARLHDFMICQ